MRNAKILFTFFFGLFFCTSSVFGYYNPKKKVVHNNNSNSSVSFREQCVTANKDIDQDVNNVRARLTTGGDVWWNRRDGKYVVPKVEPGQQEVSSLYAGAVWLGGFDKGDNLKVACQTYGNRQGQSDFWPGPLSDETATTDKVFCDQWERFFEVSGEEVQQHLLFFQNAKDGIAEYTESMIPKGLKEWPAIGNPFFFSEVGFELPFTTQGLAGFWDENLDEMYNPLDGDFPTIEIRGCEEFPDGTPRPPQFPDEMIFWIYNDEGGGAIHGESNGLSIRMEVQVQAFGYATNDEINNMTFQRYKLINRAKEDIDSTYFAMWVDPDLGCSIDDYIGCDVDRSLAYAYNIDAVDGDPQCTGIGVYGENVPIIGIDYFRGPLNEFREELGMSSFTYYNNGAFNDPPLGTRDPEDAQDFYNYLTGRWLDGTPFTYGGSAYDQTSTDYINYAFTEPPNDQNGWSMCTTTQPDYDRRTVQASGPFKLQPGAVNELIIGAVWMPDLPYPCPDIKSLLDADDISQDLFDNCFDLVDGPDAPDVDWIELDQELIAILTNKASSNNFNEEYEEIGIGFPPAEDTTYNFEGYLLYQLAGPNVDIAADIDNPERARLIYQVDVKNGINSLYNWVAEENPNYDPEDLTSREFVFFPEVKVEGADEGIRHTFRITEDQFGTTDRNLLNHRRYYFTVLAYAHNEYLPYNYLTDKGQKVTYLEGRRNIQTYGPIPRPIIDRVLNADYGDGPVITRTDGIGAGGNDLEISEESYAEIVESIRNNTDHSGIITYKGGKGPIDVTVYNPLDVVDGEFQLTFIDENMGNSKLDNNVSWLLTNVTTGETFQSDRTIDKLNEQIFGQYGFTITIGQTADVGDWADPFDGAIGYEQTYKDFDKPFWFNGIPSGHVPNELPGFVSDYFTYISHRDNWENREHEVLGNIGPGFFVPYQVCEYEDKGQFFITPAWRSYGGGLGQLIMTDESEINNLNNVDIVFTSDKSLWSRCVVVETMAPEYRTLTDITNRPVKAEDKANIGEDIAQFDLRAHPSVSKEAGDDGLPLEDGDGHGMGWFPGYVIDVETGKRLNVFFGENSAYREDIFGPELVDQLFGGTIRGADMMFNPDDRAFVNLGVQNFPSYYVGGQHWMYVTDSEYDGCAEIRPLLEPTVITFDKREALLQITWAGMPVPQGTSLLSYEQGLIPNDVTVRLRVDNPYDVKVGTGDFNGYPTYKFKIEGKQASELDQAGEQAALDAINVVPNPYYAFSDYETATNASIVKITNLPPKCVVTIYSLDGKFIRQYNRDEQPGNPFGSGINNGQVIPDLEWDIKNNKGIKVAAGVYLIHVDSELGERTLKWFGINRRFDPSGL